MMIKGKSYLLDPIEEGKKGNFAGSKWSPPVTPAAELICLHQAGNSFGDAQHLTPPRDHGLGRRKAQTLTCV